jgi:cell fate regulator YaaT (PSP1 superfamily)
MIKFNKHNVTDTETKTKARVLYSLDNRVDGRKCVTIYAKDYDRSLGKIFNEYENDTDTMTDYFDEGRVILFEDHPLYKQARERAESK